MADIICSNKTCPSTYPSARWGKSRAARKGWFFTMNKAWCPQHNPNHKHDRKIN